MKRIHYFLFMACLIIGAIWPVTANSGELVAWGYNNHGQTNVPAGNDFVAVAGGSEHSLALKTDGSLVAWGNNSYGQTDVPVGNNIVAIAAGGWHNLAIKTDGSLIAWGYNNHGETNVPAGNDFVAVAAGHFHSLALKSDGSLVGWGWNAFGQADVPTGNDFVAVSAGDDHHSLALKADGSLVAWGWSAYDQLLLPSGSDFVAIAAGNAHNLALRADGSLAAAGRDQYGETNAPTGNDFVAIAAGAEYGLALKADGSLVGWGRNIEDQIKDIPAGNDFTAVDAGFFHGLAIRSTIIGNQPPVANAGPDQIIIEIGTTVQLNGCSSWDDDGDPLSYDWLLISKPEESQATLSDSTICDPTFVADVQGDYEIELVVDDTRIPSEPDNVNVSFQNIKPVANAGNNQSVVQGDIVYLDGSGSYDANLDPLTYLWNILSKPSDSITEIEGPTLMETNFIADVPGEYVVSLIINDNFLDSDSNDITIVVLTYQDATIEALQETSKAINTILDDNVFKNPKNQNALSNKINAVFNKINKGKYLEALDKLENDILDKTNGCSETGSPDNNDWIRDCESQNKVYFLIMETIIILENLI